MPVTAKLQYLRIAPRKVRLVADLIRGKSIEEAQAILGFTIKRASQSLNKLLKQAVANAKNNFQMDPANLYIAKITVDEGPKYKRWQPRSRGQAYEIQKKTSHIIIILNEIEKKAKKIRKTKSKAVIPEESKKTEQEKIIKWEKPKIKPRPKSEFEKKSPQINKGIQKIFRRKAF